MNETTFSTNTPQPTPQATPQPTPQPAWGTPPHTPYSIYRETPEQKQARAALFASLFLPTLIYAGLYTFFLYDTVSSITVPLFVIATVAYCFYYMNKAKIQLQKGSYFYAAAMLLLGFSSASTGSAPIIVMNTLGIIFLLICMLLHNFYNDSGWTFGKYASSVFLSVFGAIGCIGDLFSDAACCQQLRKHKRQSKLIYIGIGIAIAIPLLLVIILLLSFADAVFAQFIRDIRISWNPVTVIGIGATFLFALFSSYCGIRYLGKHQIKETVTSRRKFEPLVAITILALISVVYLIFSLIQVLYLFWGKMQLPQNYTYAAYAREGFFQLLFVCMLNVAIVLFMLAFFRKNTVLNILLAVISFCTYIMLASSAYRMVMYIQNYNLTFLRIFVLWSLAVIALLLAGILIQIFRPGFPLFQYGLAIVFASYLVLSFSHPDYWIAKYNLDDSHQQAAQNMDYFYLSRLSSDAAPVISHYEGDWVDRYSDRILASSESGNLRRFNFSRAYAENLFAEE